MWDASCTADEVPPTRKCSRKYSRKTPCGRVGGELASGSLCRDLKEHCKGEGMPAPEPVSTVDQTPGHAVLVRGAQLEPSQESLDSSCGRKSDLQMAIGDSELKGHLPQK